MVIANELRRHKDLLWEKIKTNNISIFVEIRN